MLDNALGYGGYLVASMMKESQAGEVKDHPNNRANKEAFRRYMEMFPEGREAISIKYKWQGSTTTTSSRAAPSTSHGPASTTSGRAAPSTSDDEAPSTSAAPVSVRPKAAPSTSGTLSSRAVPYTSTPVPHCTLAPPPCNVDDRDLVLAAENVEESLVTQSKLCLPAGWIPALPLVDQQWISKALFKWTRTGQPELDFTKVDRMWWYPPQPALNPTGIPPMERYFGHPLFLWMPRKLWCVRLLCPHGDCGREELTSQDSTRGYASWLESQTPVTYLACKGCKRKVISWSHNIVSQLDIGHWIQFPCILTSKLGCDMQVVRLMRQRGLEKQQQPATEAAGGTACGGLAAETAPVPD
ncbi:hypothetical protein ACEWY4_021583 [Coilia grayii]|uniref:DUF6729 domain-containing protein n=1 Tax=Coilia grayii TaxID=363190 RepID=A0ABD1J9D8_9TELE